MHNNQPLEILLVEDNPGDIRLTIEALKDCKVANNLNVVRDGVEAMSFLHKNNQYANVILPDIILLDLNMPKKNGCEVLAEIKKDPKLKNIPVLILSTSHAQQDLLKAYNLKVNDFLTKTINLDQFVITMKIIEDLWQTKLNQPAANTLKQ